MLCTSGHTMESCNSACYLQVCTSDGTGWSCGETHCVLILPYQAAKPSMRGSGAEQPISCVRPDSSAACALAGHVYRVHLGTASRADQGQGQAAATHVIQGHAIIRSAGLDEVQ